MVDRGTVLKSFVKRFREQPPAPREQRNVPPAQLIWWKTGSNAGRNEGGKGRAESEEYVEDTAHTEPSEYPQYMQQAPQLKDTEVDVIMAKTDALLEQCALLLQSTESFEHDSIELFRSQLSDWPLVDLHERGFDEEEAQEQMAEQASKGKAAELEAAELEAAAQAEEEAMETEGGLGEVSEEEQEVLEEDNTPELPPPALLVDEPSSATARAAGPAAAAPVVFRPAESRTVAISSLETSSFITYLSSDDESLQLDDEKESVMSGLQPHAHCERPVDLIAATRTDVPDDQHDSFRQRHNEREDANQSSKQLVQEPREQRRPSVSLEADDDDNDDDEPELAPSHMQQQAATEQHSTHPASLLEPAAAVATRSLELGDVSQYMDDPVVAALWQRLTELRHLQARNVHSAS